jgi:hypothetical protein
MTISSKVIEQERDRRGALAAAVWVESIAAGGVLGAAGAALLVAIGFVAGDFTADAPVILIAAAVVGGGFGFCVGTIVGVAQGLLVTFAHRRLGARVVATLMPLNAMAISLSLTYACFHSAGTRWAIGMQTLAAGMTMPGALWIARRYLKRAEGRRVH